MINNIPIRTKIIFGQILLIAMVTVFIYSYYPKQQDRAAMNAVDSKIRSISNIFSIGVGGIGMGETDFVAVSDALEWAHEDSALVYISVVGKEIELKVLVRIEDLLECQIAYITDWGCKYMNETIRTVEGHGILVVTKNFPIYLANQIEVVYGPGSALYGADAMAGVINIITKKVGDDNDVTVNATGGTQGYSNVSAIFNKKLESDFKLTIAGEYSYDESPIFRSSTRANMI